MEKWYVYKDKHGIMHVTESEQTAKEHGTGDALVLHRLSGKPISKDENTEGWRKEEYLKFAKKLV